MMAFGTGTYRGMFKSAVLFLGAATPFRLLNGPFSVVFRKTEGQYLLS